MRHEEQRQSTKAKFTFALSSQSSGAWADRQAGRQAGGRSECGMSAAAFYAKLYKGIQRNTHTQTHACTCSPGKCLLSRSSLQPSGNSLLGTRTVCIMMHCSAWRPARPILPSCPAASPACFLWSSPLSSCPFLPPCLPPCTCLQSRNCQYCQ